MLKKLGLFVVLNYSLILFAQSSFEKKFQTFSKDTLLQGANISFCMLNTKTGSVIFEKNSQQLLPPASTLKTFTTSSALHYLGKNFRYETKFSFNGIFINDTALGELIIEANGDPSLGSDRFNETKPLVIFNKIDSVFKSKGIKHLKGNIKIIQKVFTDSSSNVYWLEEDFGNYYGAGVFPFNWKENKFDIFLKTKDSTFEIVRNDGGLNNQHDFKIELLQNNLPTAKDAYAYILQNSNYKYALRGEFPTSEKEQILSLARINPAEDFKTELIAFLKQNYTIDYIPLVAEALPKNEVFLFTHFSPVLSQLVFWCNQKSLNLYAESFCKTIAFQKNKNGDWKEGIELMKQFAHLLQIDTSKINLHDASGLAPDNKINTQTLATLLYKYTTIKSFPIFYESLPIINNLKMKSGYIGGTRSYTGYMTLKDSTKTSFAIIVNNYHAKPKQVKEKIFTFLNVIKE